jgi:signal transduction histidine kinase
LIVLLAFAGVSAGGVVVFGPYVPTYIAFLYPTMAPHIVFAFLYRYPYWQLMAALESTFVVALPLLAWRYSRQLVTGFRLQFANLDLAEDLRRQKDIAETANRAKSQFLAAVSHDLRQPIHALGLFIGALRGREMDGEAQRLVDFIDRSVEAMDALFNALLDISKLDAGAVQPHFETVALAPLLKRLCDEYATEAERKGLAIRYRSCSCSVRSDPALLERILRNLITNAVRYTEHGGVLVGCRREAGAVRIEVWDTGCGISPEQTDLIFQEFYQVGNRERDRSKGVGLGLAIVRRTSDLLGATLTFGSRPEHGSVFRLTLEPAADVPAIPTKPSALCAPRIVEALILVVDDDVDIQQAMKGLLTSWGYRVALGGSGDEIIASVEDRLQPPNLIICDYRLRGQETGVDVIRRLHQRYGDAMIPAILITGDTAPDRIVDARASGFALLHKPLSNSRLRAAIGNLLRA